MPCLRAITFVGTPGVGRSALCLAVLLLSVSRVDASVTFTNTARLSVNVGSDGPQAIALADVNKDNRPDIIAVSQDTDEVNVFLNDGFGGFGGGPNPFNVGASPVAVATGDFDQDGNVDLVTVNIDSNTVTILFGDSTGAFNAGRQDYPVNLSPVGVAVADYNNDGKPDLAVLNDNTVYLLMSNGNRSFTPGSPASINTRSAGGTAITTGLFNGDGFPDLAISNIDADNVSVFLGNGNGTFKAASLQNVGSGPDGIVTGDWNGDSKIDIAVVDSSEIADLNVSLLFGNGDGTFQNDVRTTAEVEPVTVADADFDGNGRLDLAVTNVSGLDNSVNVLLYDPAAPNAENGFALQDLITGLSLGQGQVAVKAADLNADGRPDLVALGQDTATIGVFINTTGKPITATPSVTPTGTPTPSPRPGTCPEQDLGSMVPQTVTGTTQGGARHSDGKCGGAAAPERTFLFTAASKGTYVFDTTGSALDTVLSVRADACGGPELGCNDDAGSGSHSSRITLPLLAGQHVILVVDGFAGDSGLFTLHVSRLGGPPSGPVGGCPEQDLGRTVPQSVTGSTLGGAEDLGGSCGGSGAPTRTFLFTAPAAGTYTIDTNGSDFDTVLIARADTCNGLELACSDDFGGPTSQLTLALTAGQRVVVVVSGFAGSSGDFVLNISTATPPMPDCPEYDLGSAVPLTISGSTAGGSRLSGGACGGGAAPERTFLYTAPSSGTYVFDTAGSELDTVLSLRADVCRGAELACNDDAQSGEHSSRVTLPLIAGQHIVVVVDGSAGQSGNFRLHISRLTTPVPYCQARDLPSTVPQTISGSTVGGANSLGASCGGLGAPEQTFVYTTPVDGTYTFDSLGSDFDTVLAIRADTCGGTELGCNDDFSGTASRLTLPLSAGQRIVIVVDGFTGPSGASAGNFTLHITASQETGLMNTSFEDNGGVGTDAFAFWTVNNDAALLGSWFVQSGPASPISSFTVPEPPDGSFAAMSDQFGPGRHLLYQDFTVPNAGGRLSCLAFVRSDAEFTVPQPETLDPSGIVSNQHVRVDIMDPTAPADDVGAGVWQNLFLTRPGDPGSPVNPMLGYTTIATSLDAFAGRRVRLRFAEVDTLNYLNFGVDNCAVSPTLACVGDCNGDGVVAIDDILTMVKVALGTGDVGQCPSGDANGTGSISVSTVIQGVNSALNGCTPPSLAMH